MNKLVYDELKKTLKDFGAKFDEQPVRANHYKGGKVPSELRVKVSAFSLSVDLRENEAPVKKKFEVKNKE